MPLAVPAYVWDAWAHPRLQYSIKALHPHQAGHPRDRSKAESQENNFF